MQEEFSNMSTLNKAQLENQAWSLNTEKYDALFTARGEMIRASSQAFIKGKIDHTHVVCWKTPYDEPFAGANAVELKTELTEKVIGGVLERDDRGKRVEDPSLLNLIMADISQWARDMLVLKQDNYFVRDFQEVYDYKYSVAARVANTAVLLEVSYV
jgi:hypothetical protein